MMSRLPLSRAAWGSDGFAEILKAELGALAPDTVPLHWIASSGYPLDTQLSVILINALETEEAIEVRLGIFFEEILPGCSCGDEPEPQPAYGELILQIDKATALARFAPIEGRVP
jgi:hypothetical protein